MRLPNGARLLIEGHEFAWEAKNLEKFALWVACAHELNPGYYMLENRLTVWCPLADKDPPRRGDPERAMAASGIVADQLLDGKHVLVTCAMGLNRSSLVAGMALRRLGFTGPQVVDSIRYARMRAAESAGIEPLSNRAFYAMVMS
jgi:protein-tyrosine phosphatase